MYQLSFPLLPDWIKTHATATIIAASNVPYSSSVPPKQLTTRLLESHIGDRKLVNRLAEIREHVVMLKELRVKVDAVKADFLQTTWDGESLRVRQVKTLFFCMCRG